jgi:hypothetical protein
MKELSPTHIQQIIELDYIHHKGKKPRAITLYNPVPCIFLDLYNNHFEGWFVTATFQTMQSERWLVVLLPDGEEDWWIEKVQ